MVPTWRFLASLEEISENPSVAVDCVALRTSVFATRRRSMPGVEGYRITHMTWNPSTDHHHPTDVTYEKPDGTWETVSADRLPFSIEGDVSLEGQGVVVRAGVCTKCGQHVLPVGDTAS